MPLPLLLPSAEIDVLVFGENSLDIVGRTSGDTAVAGKQTLAALETLPGGQGATAAVGCARLGVKVRYLGVWGDDAWGRTGRDALAAEHVDVVAIERPGARSRTAIIVVAPDGNRTVYEHRDPRLTLADPTPVVDALAGTRIVLVDATDIRASLALARAARAAGVRVVVDVDRPGPSVEELLAATDVIIVPEDFVPAFTGENGLGAGVRALAGRFRPAAVVVTRGELGTFTVMDDHEIHTPGYATSVTDTTGAGDAFRAAFCSAWARALQPAELPSILEFANAAAALSCRGLGAWSGLPSRAEVQALVTAQGPRRSKP
jgi:sugar/nucleoside kinase (ribokinase family)